MNSRTACRIYWLVTLAIMSSIIFVNWSALTASPLSILFSLVGIVAGLVVSWIVIYFRSAKRRGL